MESYVRLHTGTCPDTSSHTYTYSASCTGCGGHNFSYIAETTGTFDAAGPTANPTPTSSSLDASATATTSSGLCLVFGDSKSYSPTPPAGYTQVYGDSVSNFFYKNSCYASTGSVTFSAPLSGAPSGSIPNLNGSGALIMRTLLAITLLTSTLWAQPDFVALDKELHQLQAQEKGATPAQLAIIKQREDFILKAFNTPHQANFDTVEAARYAVWKARKDADKKSFCTAHPEGEDVPKITRFLIFMFGTFLSVPSFGQAVFARFNEMNANVPYWIAFTDNLDSGSWDGSTTLTMTYRRCSPSIISSYFKGANPPFNHQEIMALVNPGTCTGTITRTSLIPSMTKSFNLTVRNPTTYYVRTPDGGSRIYHLQHQRSSAAARAINLMLRLAVAEVNQNCAMGDLRYLWINAFTYDATRLNRSLQLRCKWLVGIQ